LVEVESADEACSVDGPLLGPPRLPARPPSRPAVYAVAGNGVRTGAMIVGTGAMIAGTDANSIVHSVATDVLTVAPAGAVRRVIPPAHRGSGQHTADPSQDIARSRLLPGASGARRRLRDSSARRE
jgi:hypothetical protein